MIQKAIHIFLLKSGAVFFRFRNSLFPVFIVVTLIFTKPALFLGKSGADIFVVICGFIIALTGAFFRLFVIGLAYIKRGGKGGKVYADDLVTEGIYAHVRNPMYVANFLAVVGMALIYGSPWVYIIIIPLFAYIYLSIISAEEEYLYKHFGAQYEAYCKKVNRFVPDFSGLRGTLKQFSFDWKKAIRKDYGTFIGIAAGSYAIWLCKDYHFYNLSHSEYKIFIMWGPFVLFAMLYSYARYLKKTGRLTSGHS